MRGFIGVIAGRGGAIGPKPDGPTILSRISMKEPGFSDDEEFEESCPTLEPGGVSDESDVGGVSGSYGLSTMLSISNDPEFADVADVPVVSLRASGGETIRVSSEIGGRL